MSGAALKWIAIITMLIDHVGAAILKFFPHKSGPMYYAYEVCRDIGRIAFPLFIFLLVEGFTHTKNSRRYLLRLFIFALVSEIPFDLAFRHTSFYLKSQNVFFTLFTGLLVIYAIDRIEKESLRVLKPSLSTWCFIELLTIGLLLVGCLAGQFLEMDYHAVGVLAIVVAYLTRKNRYLRLILVCVILLFSSMREAYSFLAFIPAAFYNGKRGRQNKYFFYIFYPAHLLVLYLIYKLILLS